MEVFWLSVSKRRRKVGMKDKKELILEILDIFDGLSVADAKYLLGYARGFEDKKELRNLEKCSA